MKKNEIKTLLISRVGQELFLAPEDYKDFLEKHESKEATNYYQLIKAVNKINIKVVKKMLPECEFDLSKLYLSNEEITSFYFKIFNFLFFGKLNLKGVSVLSKIERRCGLNSRELYEYREEQIKNRYISNINLNGFTKASLSYFYICSGNDGQIDDQEIGRYKELVNLSDFKFNLPLHVFDLSDNALRLEIGQEKKSELIKELYYIAQCDGEVHLAEKKFIRKISNVGGYSEQKELLSLSFELILKLALIMSDGKISIGEKRYFIREVAKYGFLKTISDGFMYKLLMFQNKKIYKKESRFLDLFWNESNIHFSMVEKLFNVFEIRYLNHNDRKEKKVEKEDVLLFLCLIISKKLDSTRLNQLVSKDYIELLYMSLSFENTNLDYFYIASSLLIDKKMTGREYEILWRKISSQKINFIKLERAINDYSLLHCEEYEIDTYLDYLRKDNKEAS